MCIIFMHIVTGLLCNMALYMYIAFAHGQCALVSYNTMHAKLLRLLTKN